MTHDKPFCGTFMWNLDVELREPESFCEAFSGTLEPLFVEPGNFYEWNFYVEPWDLPQTTPKLYWKIPKFFKLLGKNTMHIF